MLQLVWCEEEEKLLHGQGWRWVTAFCSPPKARRCPIPCTAALSSEGTGRVEGSLPCVCCTTFSVSPRSRTGFQWGGPRHLSGQSKQLGEQQEKSCKTR